MLRIIPAFTPETPTASSVLVVHDLGGTAQALYLETRAIVQDDVSVEGAEHLMLVGYDRA